MWGLGISLGGIPCAIFFPKFQACSDRSLQFLHLGWRILPCKQWSHQQRDDLLIPCCPLCRRYKTKTGWVLARNRWALRISLQLCMIFRHQLRPLVFCWTGSLWSIYLSCRGCRRTWVFPGDGYDWLCQRPWKNPLSGHPSAFHLSCFWGRRLGISIAEFHMIFYPWNHVGAGRGCCSGWHVSWCCLLWCAPSSCMRYMSGKWACGYWVSYSCPSCKPGLHLPFSNRQGYMLTEFIYNKENHQTKFVSLCLKRVKRVDIFLNHFHNGMLPPSSFMLPPSVGKAIKLGPDNISGERIIYHIHQKTDYCSRSGNCLIYGTPCGDLSSMFPPANLLFVQS